MVLFCILACAARADTPPAPRTFVVLFAGLTADDLRNPLLPHLQRLAETGQVGLMNTAVAGPRTDTAAVLTLALGTQAPAEPTDEDAYEADEPVEGATAAVVFQRRTGLAVRQGDKKTGRHGDQYPIPNTQYPTPNTEHRTPNTILHLGIAPLTRRGVNTGLVGAALAQAGKSGALVVCGNADTDRPQRRAALFVVDERGIGPPGLLSGQAADDPDALARWAAAQPVSVVIELGGGARVEEMRDHRALGFDYASARRAALVKLDRLLAALEGAAPLDRNRLLLVSPRPPANAGGAWDRLPPVALAGPGVHPGLLASATTRTPGIVANVDIAPTLLDWLGAPAPATMTGHPLVQTPAPDALADIARLDRSVTVNGHALVPEFSFIGVLAALAGFGGMAALKLRRGTGAASRFALPLLAVMNMPLAMLLAVPFRPGSVVAQTAVTVALMLACGAVETAAGGWLARRIGGGMTPAEASLLLLAAATILLPLADTFVGQPLVKFSLLSFYQLQGIRYYGIGNEYMGIIVGCALVLAFLGRLRPGAAAWMFVLVALILSLPGLGSKAGVVIVAAVAFGTAWMVLRGGRARWPAAVGWTALGFAAAFALAALEDVLPSGPYHAPSHIGGALQSAGRRGYGYLGVIAARKLAMNFRVLIHPGTLSGVLGVGAAVLLFQALYGDEVQAVARAHPRWARALPAVAWGALAALLFNDSGVVAAIFVFAAWLGAGMYLMFRDAARPIRTTAEPASTLCAPPLTMPPAAP